MARVELKDKVMSPVDFVQFTTDLQLRQPGTSVHTGNTRTSNGKMELHDPVIEYDETAVSEADIEKISSKHGFVKR
jgi:hypothetical protein